MIEKMFSKLEFYLDNDVRTVLLEGEKGIGKTLVIEELFNKKFGRGNWRYYSGATMDPHIDMIGCPIKITDEASGKEYLDLIQPKDYALDQVQAIFIDEWNRSKEAVRNACLELIQFSRMNGKEFKNLKFIWAAINPDNGDYQVDEMDEAQRDRFEVHLKLPYELSETFFKKKYDSLAEPAIEWWKTLPVEIKKLVSPRRLDYALKFFNKGGELIDILDQKSNPGKLVAALKAGSYISRYKKLKENYNKNPQNTQPLIDFFDDHNNFLNIREYVIKNSISDCQFFSEENLSNLLASNDTVFTYILNSLSETKYSSLIDSITQSNLNTALSDKIKNHPKHIEYSFVKDEPEDPRCKQLEEQVSKFTDKDKLIEFVELNKIPLVGSELTVKKILSLNNKDFDGNKDPLIYHLMMNGLES